MLFLANCSRKLKKEKETRRISPSAQKNLKRYLGIILIVISLFPALHAHSQQITLNVKNAPLIQAFDKISAQTGFEFFYKEETIIHAKNVNISIQNVNLRDALNQLFKGQPFTYEISNKTIVIIDKVKLKTQLNPNLIRGIVTDSAGSPLKGVVISNESAPTPIEVYSNSDGSFAIEAKKQDIIKASAPGFYDDTSAVIGQKLIKLVLNNQLSNIQIQSYAIKKDPTTSIDLNHKLYMNLGQILQGTVPGLSVQIVNSSTKQVTGVEVLTHNNGNGIIHYFQKLTVDEFLAQVGASEGQKIINGLLDGSLQSNDYKLLTTTVTTNSLVPQIRGANTFSANSSSMLVVIDGFPQSGFPADYPMANVESIDVIKDPVELTKWGPSAAGGMIMIKTKTGKPGYVRLNYTGNFYYMTKPKYSYNKMRQTDSKDYLDYLRAYDSLRYTPYNPDAIGLTPALYLLAAKATKTITDDQFENSWDSLGNLNNEQQLNMLQQNAFTQSHILNATGGGRFYNYSLTGNYSYGQNNNLGSYTKTGGFNLNTHFNLLKNKLKIDWLLKYNNAKSNTGTAFDPNNTIEPYQMLLDNSGNYVYDYSALSQVANSLIESKGYKNYGVNLLQDAKVNKLLSTVITKQARLNTNWLINDNLVWTSSIYYNTSDNIGENLYDKSSSYVRQLVDFYGEMQPDGSISYYVPYGNIMQKSKQRSYELNVRTNLSFTKAFGKNHINASFGAGGADLSSYRPVNSVLYGYNTKTKTGAPVFLPSDNPQENITNFYSLLSGFSSSAYPYTLSQLTNGDTTKNRNLNWNLALGYGYGDFFNLTGSLTSVLTPQYGLPSGYSQTLNQKLEATGLLIDTHKKKNFFNRLLISVGEEGMKMPNLPVQYSNIRYQQVNWGDYTIWVNGMNPTQQQGQKTLKIYQKLTVDLFKGNLILNVAYNTLKTSGITSFTSTTDNSSDSSYTQRFASAELKGQLRHNTINYIVKYDKSPEGQTQVNGNLNYDLTHESFFHSNRISTLKVSGLLENISSYQGLQLMMGTNVASGSGFSTATNSSFSQLPPANVNWETHFSMGLDEDRYFLDLRYYNHRTSNLNNYTTTYTDPSTGLSSQTTYSTITNKGVEFYLKTQVVKNRKLTYTVTLNGAYNVNIAKSVPTTAFTATDQYVTAYRNGYNTSTLWTYKWAGLDDKGDPQIYNANNQKTATLDSSTLSSSLVMGGLLKAPWTGGLIHEIMFEQFFARVSMVFNWGYVMKNYMPTFSNIAERSIRTKDRWREPGDEKKTDVPAISTDGSNSFRSFVIQNTSNNILSANNVRLQEIMIGYNLPTNIAKKMGFSSCVFTCQAQNVALWTKNKLHIDPATVGMDGRVGLPIPKQYSCTLNIGF